MLALRIEPMYLSSPMIRRLHTGVRQRLLLTGILEAGLNLSVAWSQGLTDTDFNAG